MSMEQNEVQVFKEKPDVDALKHDYERAKANLSAWMDKAEDAREVRFNEWPGKTGDGKKHGPQSFPFDGAADLDPMLINPLVDSDVALLVQSVMKANLVAAPTESSDVASAKLVTDFLRWRFGTMDELMRECSIGANYLLQNGCVFFGTYWKEEKTRVFRDITIDEIAQQSPELASAIQDKDLKEGVEEMFHPIFPNLKKKRVNKMLRELREKGESKIPTEKIVTSRPAIKAYELGRELIVDSNVIDLEQARSIHVINYYTPEALKQKVNEGWDADWIDEAIEKSKSFDVDERYTDSMMSYDYQSHYGQQHYEGLIKVVATYRKSLDEDDMPIVEKTCWVDELDEAGFHAPIEYDEGRYPFVCIVRENLNHRLLDSRGYPELLKSFEQQIKREIDSQADRSSMSTLPPVFFQIGRRPERLGPGAQVPVRRRDEIGFMEIPPYSQATKQVEMDIRKLANKITGRATDDTDAVEASVVKQHLVNCWLTGWTHILKRIWVLDRTYSGPTIWFRVTGNESGAQLMLDETAEIYDFTLTWNQLNADESKVLEKLDSIGKIMATYDRSGVSRFDVYVRKVLEAVDPNLAQELIMPQQEATTKEIMETSNDIAKIASGQVVNIPQNGVNAQLRLQVLQQYLNGTPEVPSDDIAQKLQENERFRQRLETYQKQLQFILTQQENARIGAIGTTPGNMPGSSTM